MPFAQNSGGFLPGERYPDPLETLAGRSRGRKSVGGFPSEPTQMPNPTGPFDPSGPMPPGFPLPPSPESKGGPVVMPNPTGPTIPGPGPVQFPNPTGPTLPGPFGGSRGGPLTGIPAWAAAPAQLRRQMLLSRMRGF